jgi:hypothetical protein
MAAYLRFPQWTSSILDAKMKGIHYLHHVRYVSGSVFDWMSCYQRQDING